VVAVKVWLGGEGPSELGTRADGGDDPGVIEALLLKVEPTGWIVGGALRWKYIRKYRAGHAARGGDNHEDLHNVCGLALTAWEAGCEVLAFARDVDADDRRADAIARGIALASEQFPMLVVIGGVARPAIEGWVLALVGVRDADELSRARALELLRARTIEEKQASAYVEIVSAAELDRLPVGCGSLAGWIATARTRLGRALRGR
jgi:hypothetical protein